MTITHVQTMTLALFFSLGVSTIFIMKSSVDIIHNHNPCAVDTGGSGHEHDFCDINEIAHMDDIDIGPCPCGPDS